MKLKKASPTPQIKSCWRYLDYFLLIAGILTLLALAINYKNFPIILSIFSNLFLVWLLAALIRFNKLHFQRWEIYIYLFITFLWIGYYIYSILTRNFIYYWDFVNYYNIQINYENMFNGGVLQGLKYIQSDIWFNDYTCFINIFTTFPFCFTNKTVDGYILAYSLNVLPLLFACFLTLLHMISEKYFVRHPKAFIGSGMLFMTSLPLLHRSALWGQPDYWGLILIFILLIATLNYNFETTNLKILFVIWFSTLALIITRRWYMYWIAGFFLFYGTSIIFYLFTRKENGNFYKSLIRLITFSGFSVISISALLFPMLMRILTYDYGDRYSFYMNGGFKSEIFHQINILGYSFLLIIITGFLYGILSTEFRKLAVIAIGTWISALFLFTRVQNMGYHQSLILVPSYLLFGVMFCAFISSLKNRHLWGTLATAVFCTNTIFCFVKTEGTQNKVEYVLSNCSLKIPLRNDIKEIQSIISWLSEHCSYHSEAYMIPHGIPYNPDVFRNANLPDLTMQDYLPYGSAVLGTQPFPVTLLDARYILTCDPFCNHDIAYKYNDAFLELMRQGRFQLIETFPMPDGYFFYVYERIVPPSIDDIEFYREYFKEENQKFPDMYDEVFDQYILDHNLK